MEYVYAYARSLERAELLLEDMFAAGEVSEGERPRIVKRGRHWVILLRD